MACGASVSAAAPVREAAANKQVRLKKFFKIYPDNRIFIEFKTTGKYVMQRYDLHAFGFK